MANSTQLTSGSTLQGGKYRIGKVLGQGGFGITYEAEQVSLDRKVAIKEFFMKEYCNRDSDTSYISVPSTGSKDLVEKFKQKFVKEAKLIAGLNHSNIIKIHDVFEEHGTAYYVMEYLGGGSLSSYVESKGRLPESEAIGFIRQVGSALSYIHGMSINHLDVKPGNILLDGKGRAVLIDFGLSKRYDDTGHQTSSTPVGISHGYAPMEQYISGGVSSFSPQTDIYSLGATLFKMLTGQTPPNAEEVSNDGLPQWEPNISVPVRQAIEKAMQPRRKDRVQTVDAFLSMLTVSPSSTRRDESTSLDNAVRDNKKPTPKPTLTPVPKPSRKWMRWFFPCLIVAFMLVVAGVWWYIDLTSHDVSGTVNGYEYVDLGLSVNWATKNVGAFSPSAYGDYYAWGETSTKSRYLDSNSLTSDKSFSDIAGNPTYDVARKKWGSSWRLPRKSEFEELKDRCTWVWTTQGGHKGYKVTGPNGNSIFLPAAGMRSGGVLDFADKSGSYWSSSPNSSGSKDAYYLGFFDSMGQEVCNCYNRQYGYTVRPVLDQTPVQPPLSKTKLYVTTNPSGATVLLDGKKIGVSPLNGTEVPQGNHTVKLTLEGYESYTTQRSFSDNPVVINENLKIPNAKLYVTTTPSGASVYVDGQKVGVTPLNGKELPQGSHSVKITIFGYEDYVRTFNFGTEPVVLNETLTVRANMINGYEYVDLGLSVKWATKNVGASSPSDYGDYYAWGETSTKSEYRSSNSLTYEKSFSDIAGNPTYDVARKKWGSSWRLPRKSEFEELKDRCTWVWTTQGGHKGYKVTGPNGNSIFLPAAGWRGVVSLYDAGEGGYYWSSSPDSSDSKNAYSLNFDASGQNVSGIYRGHGRTVRPVSE